MLLLISFTLSIGSIRKAKIQQPTRVMFVTARNSPFSRWRIAIGADVACKSGTTQDNTDGWFILTSPQLVAGA